jgi:hypothetical protein
MSSREILTPDKHSQFHHTPQIRELGALVDLTQSSPTFNLITDGGPPPTNMYASGQN